MANPKLFVSEKKKKKDGTVQIYIVVHLMRKTIYLKTGVSCQFEKFDKGLNKIKGTGKETKDNNLILRDCLALVNDIFIRYRLQHKQITPELLKKEYKNPTLYIDFYKFLEEKIKEREKNKEINYSSVKQHRILLNQLKQFKTTLTFAEIDETFINRFKNSRSKPPISNKINTIQKYMSHWNTYMNIAKKDGLISINPFDNMIFKRVEPNKVWLTEKEFKQLKDFYDKKRLPEHLHNTLRWYLFMCVTGLRISDFMKVEKKHIQNGSLVIVPYKTRRYKVSTITIPLIKYAHKLIKHENSPNNFLFNTISEQKINNNLKDIASFDKENIIHKNLSNHTARHTFATMFLEKTDDVATLQKILGHSRITETMGYVHISNKKIKQQMKNFEQLMS